jgi:hypothetical protein
MQRSLARGFLFETLHRARFCRPKTLFVDLLLAAFRPGEDASYDWRDRGGFVSDVLAYAKLRTVQNRT